MDILRHFKTELSNESNNLLCVNKNYNSPKDRQCALPVITNLLIYLYQLKHISDAIFFFLNKLFCWKVLVFPSPMSCHKSIAVITGMAHCFLDYIVYTSDIYNSARPFFISWCQYFVNRSVNFWKIRVSYERADNFSNVKCNFHPVFTKTLQFNIFQIFDDMVLKMFKKFKDCQKCWVFSTTLQPRKKFIANLTKRCNSNTNLKLEMKIVDSWKNWGSLSVQNIKWFPFMKFSLQPRAVAGHCICLKNSYCNLNFEKDLIFLGILNLWKSWNKCILENVLWKMHLRFILNVFKTSSRQLWFILQSETLLSLRHLRNVSKMYLKDVLKIFLRQTNDKRALT